MKINKLTDIRSLAGKTVLVRADFNVPINKKEIESDYKINRGTLTLKFLAKKKARVIVVSHLGRPKKFERKLSLAPVVRHLAAYGAPVEFLGWEVGEDERGYWSRAKKAADQLKPGKILLLDNIRFFRGEEKNDRVFAKKLASLADLFVFDGFAVAHRKAASITGVTKYLPSYAGLLLAEEIEVLSRAMSRPRRPLVVVLGGAKAETKIPLLKNLLSRADRILVGGGITNTFWWARGKKIGESIIAPECKKEILKYCADPKVILPVDAVIGRADGANARVIRAGSDFAVPSGFGIYDIGPKTVEFFSQYIAKAGTVIFNGALGLFEHHPYEKGTYAITRAIARRGRGEAVTILGGGETVEILEHLKLMSAIDLVSTGGGAMLEFLSGTKLYGIIPLLKKIKR